MKTVHILTTLSKILIAPAPASTMPSPTLLCKGKWSLADRLKNLVRATGRYCGSLPSDVFAGIEFARLSALLSLDTII